MCVFAGCILGTEPIRDLAAARERWAEEGPSAYTMVISLSCFCAGPAAVRIAVRNGVVESRQNVRTGESVASEQDRFFPSVEGLFRLIEDVQEREPRRLDVTYDSTLGYPTEIAIDYSDAVDDEITYTISEFESG